MQFTLKTLFVFVTLAALVCGYFCLPALAFAWVTIALFVILPTLIVTEIVYGRGPLCGFAVGSACSLVYVVIFELYLLFGLAQMGVLSSPSPELEVYLVGVRIGAAIALGLMFISGLIGVFARAMGIRRRERWEARVAEEARAKERAAAKSTSPARCAEPDPLAQEKAFGQERSRAEAASLPAAAQ